MPMIRSARAAFDADAGANAAILSTDARMSLERQLLRDLAGVGQLALWEDFLGAAPPASTGTGRAYQPYIRSLLSSRYLDVLSAHPVLARHLVLLVDQWVDAAVEFLARVALDAGGD